MGNSDPESESLKNVYSANTVDEQREIYRKWAADYDQETVEDLGWMGFQPAAAAFGELVSARDLKLLDVGCGTGLSGQALAEQGFTNLHGVDLSPEMLERADERGIYRSLATADLTKPLTLDRNWDAVFSTGVFGFGPPHPEHLVHTIEILKPGGIACHTVNGKAWQDLDWETSLAEVVNHHRLHLLESREIPYLRNEDINGVLLVFRRQTA